MPELQIVRVRLLDPDDIPLLTCGAVPRVELQGERTIVHLSISAEMVNEALAWWPPGVPAVWTYVEIDGQRYGAPGLSLMRRDYTIDQHLWTDASMRPNVVIQWASALE